MHRVNWFRSTLVIAIAFTGLSAVAQDSKKPADKPADKPAAKPADAKPADAKPADAKAAPKAADKAAPAGDKADAGQPSPEDMAKWAAYSMPGPEHAALKPLIGTFSCEIKMKDAPDAPFQGTTGTVTRKSTLGDRFITEEVQSNWMGMPFEGKGVIGFDNGQKKYFTLWIDNMSTGTMHQVGTASGKVITLEGENWDPMQGKMIWGKSTVDLSNNDKQTMKMFIKDKNGKEYQNFEMNCTRQ